MGDITVRSVLAKFGFKVDDASLKTANRAVDDTKKGINKVESAAKQLEGEWGKMASAADIGFGKTARVAKSLGVELNKTKGSAGGFRAELAGLSGAAMGFLGGLAGAAGLELLGKMGQFFGDATDRAYQLDAAMATLPGGIEQAAEATEGLVDNFTLATTGAKALRAGLVEDGDQFAQFSGDVAKLARKAGDNVSESMGKMVDELKGGSTALLEQWGVTVDAEGAVASYAAAHGKLAEDLTETEKRQAVATASLEAMHQAASELAPALETNATRIQRLSAKLTNLNDATKHVATTVGGAFAGAVVSATDDVVAAATAAAKEAEALRELERAAGTAGQGLGLFSESVSGTLSDLGEMIDRLQKLRIVKDEVSGKPIKIFEDKAAEAYQMTASELRAQKRIEQEMQAHEDEAAYQRQMYGPERPPPKKGKGKPGPAYELRTLQLITGATGDAGDTEIREMLAGYKQGKTAKSLSVEELYDKLKRTRSGQARQDIRAQLDRHFMDLLTGGSPAGVGGPSSAGAQGLGTRIINIDARITADVTVPAPEGLVGAGEVEARRVAQTLGRDIAAELDPYFVDQAQVIRRAVEG